MKSGFSNKEGDKKKRMKIIKVQKKITGVRLFRLVSKPDKNVLSFFKRKRDSRGFFMFDDDEDTAGFSAPDSRDDDGLDDFGYYVSYIRALEREDFSKSDIARELMDEFDLGKGEAVRIVKRYFSERDSFADGEDEADDVVEDDDYSDGNSTEY